MSDHHQISSTIFSRVQPSILESIASSSWEVSIIYKTKNNNNCLTCHQHEQPSGFPRQQLFFDRIRDPHDLHGIVFCLLPESHVALKILADTEDSAVHSLWKWTHSALAVIKHNDILCQSIESLTLSPPESDHFQISPAASPEIWHHTVWRTWLFIAYSDEKWLYYKFSLHHSYNRFLKGWENTLFELRSERVNPFPPESDHFQISPAAPPEIWHHTVWRTWLFIAYSDEKWLYYKFSLHHSYNHFLKGWENKLFELRSERVNPFPPESDHFQISPAASPEILHHTVWRTWLLVAYSDEIWLHYLTYKVVVIICYKLNFITNRKNNIINNNNNNNNNSNDNNKFEGWQNRVKYWPTSVSCTAILTDQLWELTAPQALPTG